MQVIETPRYRAGISSGMLLHSYIIFVGQSEVIPISASAFLPSTIDDSPTQNNGRYLSNSAMSSPVIIVTGASRGLGEAIVSYLLGRSDSKLVLVSRTEEPLAALKQKYPERVEYLAADMAKDETPAEIIKKAIDVFGRIDSVVVNHGVLDPVAKVVDANIEAWRKAFDINFFGAVLLV
jgi:hypothetical protein